MKEFRPLVIKSNRNGRGPVKVKCPFCEREFPIFASTLSGARKSCPCGALLGEAGFTKEENKNEYNNEGNTKLA